MARGGKLSDTTIRKARGPAVLYDGDGLFLRVGRANAKGVCSKSWVLRYQLNGERHDVGLGRYPLFGLAEARQRAAAQLRLRADGIDPLSQKRAERASQRLVEARTRTFRDVAEEYIARNEAGWRNAKHRGQWRRTLEMFAYAVIGDLPVAAIDTGLVVGVLDPVWKDRPETGSRLRGRIETVLSYAAHRGLREAGLNPAQWRGHLEHSFPSRRKVRQVEHLAAMPFDELPSFMVELRDREEIAARALEFLILTACRSGELRGAVWGEINTERGLWSIPASRMKAGREHRCALSGAAIAVLDAVRPLAPQQDGSPDLGALVFPGVRQARPIAEGAMLAVLRRMGRADATAHGFRSCFRDWCAERTAFPREVVEMALAHTIENAVERAYRRGDLLEKRVQLMEAWARFCAVPMTTGEVIAISAAR